MVVAQAVGGLAVVREILVVLLGVPAVVVLAAVARRVGAPTPAFEVGRWSLLVVVVVVVRVAKYS